MENLETTIQNFLAELEKFNGNQPTFKIDYANKAIIVTEAPSGFLRELYSNNRVVAHLCKEGLYIQYFK